MAVELLYQQLNALPKDDQEELMMRMGAQEGNFSEAKSVQPGLGKWDQIGCTFSYESQCSYIYSSTYPVRGLKQ